MQRFCQPICGRQATRDTAVLSVTLPSQTVVERLHFSVLLLCTWTNLLEMLCHMWDKDPLCSSAVWTAFRPYQPRLLHILTQPCLRVTLAGSIFFFIVWWMIVSSHVWNRQLLLSHLGWTQGAPLIYKNLHSVIEQMHTVSLSHLCHHSFDISILNVFEPCS